MRRNRRAAGTASKIVSRQNRVLETYQIGRATVKLRRMPSPALPAPQTILVTGASGTIGREIVRTLSASSTRIVAHFHGNEEAARALQNETSCEMRRADLSDEVQVETLFHGLDNLFAVVHCAGIARNNLMVKQSRASWDEVMHVNCDGAFLVVRESLRRLNTGGRLIVLASRVGEIGGVGQGAYAASKAAQIALVRCAARESSARKLCVNALCPGVVESEMTRNLSDSRKAELAAQSVFQSFGSAQAVASVVSWLLGDGAAEVSGQVIHCDSRL